MWASNVKFLNLVVSIAANQVLDTCQRRGISVKHSFLGDLIKYIIFSNTRFFILPLSSRIQLFKFHIYRRIKIVPQMDLPVTPFE